ncbi:hypothetical protein DO72_1489 [Burkholderia pseudomallei]|nr:hypothetical protein DO72_1489 [Burkholderia pseudomallei]
MQEQCVRAGPVGGLQNLCTSRMVVRDLKSAKVQRFVVGKAQDSVVAGLHLGFPCRGNIPLIYPCSVWCYACHDSAVLE